MGHSPRNRRFRLLPVLLAAALACSSSDERADSSPSSEGPQEPDALLLTWQKDPTTTMTVDWHTPAGETSELTVRYRRAGADAWEQRSAEAREFDLFERTIHRAEITGLEPDTSYEFRVGEFERIYRFRTMPAAIDDEPLVFATGGDLQHAPALLHQTNEVAMEYDPDFIVWGGDLAYANAGTSPFHRLSWTRWFEINSSTLIDEEGRVVPIIVGIGNHEVKDGYYDDHDDFEASDEWRENAAPYFYNLFAFPGHPGYGTLDFGDYLSLIILDSGHTNRVQGEQSEWLDGELAERRERGTAHVIPIYHMPAFPAHRDPQGARQTRVREHWVPRFEAHDIPLAFENHDHVYKRTHPIREGEVDESGTVYMGDGAWGVGTRAGDSQDEWYIDQFAEERHAIIVTLQGDARQVDVVSETGDLLDNYGDDL